jgi:DNA-binding CsgD family transcriptional regulator
MWLVAADKNLGNLPFRLAPGSYVVGRGKAAQIVIPDTTVSRNHARLIRSNGSLLLEDLESSNGTFVNQARVTRCGLEVGNLVRFGGVYCAISSTPMGCEGLFDEETTMRVHESRSDEPTAICFTQAQRQILDLVLQGHSDSQIAELLNRSPHTVHTHLKTIFRQVGVHSRAELILKLLRRDGECSPVIR